MRRHLKIASNIMLLIILLLSLGTTAYAAPKATGVQLDPITAVIDLALGNTLQLDASVLPESASQSIEWKTSKKSVATVSGTGLVTAKEPGKVTIYARPKKVNKQTKCVITVVDSLRPTSISVSHASLKMTIGDTQAVTATANPSTAMQGIIWSSTKSSVASVSADGTITAKKAGKAQIRAYSQRSNKVYKAISVTVSKPPAPKKLTITPANTTVNVGEALALTAAPTPATANGTVTWKSSNTKVAKVSSAGVVTALKKGTVKITATSKWNTKIKTVRTLKIQDPYTLVTLSIDRGDFVLDEGEAVQLSAIKSPATATNALTWSSSNSAVASIDANGTLTAKKGGAATITLSSNNGKSAKLVVGVLDTSYATAQPLRTTSTGGINDNLSKIDAIRLSAFDELSALTAKGTISAGEASKRKAAIVEAFAMYRFPWMTQKFQRYWSTTSAAKGFQPNTVYYGMPYIQNGLKSNYSNRRYNLAKALSGGYYTKSGSHYLMSQSKKLSSLYVGSDCSSFVSMSIFGTNSSASYLSTRDIKTSTQYRTITGGGNMRPGDILNRGGKHVVMFLYYTNSAKTHMMIIEQGGGLEPNTVTCRIKSVASYTGSGYVIRRAKKFG